MRRTAFLDKTLLAVANIAEQSFFSEAYARKAGLMQSIDVRIKIIMILFLLVIVSLVHVPVSLWILYGLSLVLAVLSRVPLVFFLKRVWLFVPLFSAAIVLPAILNVVTPGDPLFVILKLERAYAWGPYRIPQEITITRQGVWGGIILVSRVAASVSFAVLFTLTTRWTEVFAGLRSFLVPRIFVMTLSMTERYLFVLLRLVQDLYRARKSRTIVPFRASGERGWIASRIGFLFRKSMDMSRDVHQAMLSRGYHGESISINRMKTSRADYFWLAAVVLAGVFILAQERGWLLEFAI